MKMRNRFAQVEINSYLCTRNLETHSDYDTIINIRRADIASILIHPYPTQLAL